MTYDSIKSSVQKKFKNATWFVYEPFNSSSIELGNEIAFGKRLRTINHFDKAELIVSIDDDFLTDPVNGVSNTKKFTSRKKLSTSKDNLIRLYSVESSLSLTGSNADTRYAVKASDFDAFVFALASSLATKLSGLDTFKNFSNEFSNSVPVKTLSKELLSAKGKSLLTGGNSLSKEANAAIALVNQALNNISSTITFSQVDSTGESLTDFKQVIDSVKKDGADVLVFIGTNPIYTSTSDIDVAGAIKSAKTSIHLSDYVDETSKLCSWHVNRSHFLEAWGDGKSFEGVESVIQPLIQPLFDSISEIEFLNIFATGKMVAGFDLVRETWKSRATSQKEWNKVLHDGILDNTKMYSSISVSTSSTAASKLSDSLKKAMKLSGDTIEVVIKSDYKLADGRFANNGWLQELPDPITKITWDNVALMSAATAAKIGLPHVAANSAEHYQNKAPKISIKTANGSITMPAWILPGHVDNSITVSTGYGRLGVGRVASSYEFSDFEVVGFDVKPLRSSSTAYVVSTSSVSATGETYKIACVQDHHSMEGRAIVRYANIDEYKAKPTFAPEMVKTPGIKPGKMFADPLFTEQSFPDYEPQWGMAIDLTSCTGCGVCTIACQAENNIPVIGKKEVSNCWNNTAQSVEFSNICNYKCS